MVMIDYAARLAALFVRRFASTWGKLRSIWLKWRFLVQVYANGGKVELPRSAHIDHPVRFAGQGRLILEQNVVLGYILAGASASPILLQPREPDSQIRIGKGTMVVNGCEFICRQRIDIGANCRIGARTTIIDADFHDLHPLQRDQPGPCAPVIIEDNVWLGNDVTVLKAVRIGRDAVVGAHCTVSKSIPAGAIAVGNPMRLVGSVYDLEHTEGRQPGDSA